jgi:hypothetical protein
MHPSAQQRSIILLMVLGSGACRTKAAPGLEGFDCDSNTGVCVPRDAGNQDVSDGVSDSTSDVRADGDEDGDGRETIGAISITSPTSPAHTNASIRIQIALTPSSLAPTHVSLLIDDMSPVAVDASLAYDWNTSSPAIAEGPHQVKATAMVDGKTITSAAIVIIVDRQSPTITQRLPAPDSTEVSLSHPIQVLFSEALAPASLPGAITLATSAGPVPTTTTLSSDGTVATIAISNRASIPFPAIVTVSVKGTVSDLAGNQLGGTASWSWTAPLWLKLGSLPGQSPSLSLGPNDEPTICSALERIAGNTNDLVLQVGRHVAGQTWDTSFGTPQGVQGSSFVTSGGSVAVGADGQPIVAWPEFQGANTGNPATIHIAKWTGTTWDKTYSSVDAVAEAGSSARSPWLAVGPAGDLFLAWAEISQALAVSIYAGRWNGTAWDVSYGGLGVVGASAPVLRFDAAGRPLIGWAGALMKAGASRWTGTAWMTTPTYANSTSATLAIDSMDRPIATSISGLSTDPYLRIYTFSAGNWVETIPAIGRPALPSNAQMVLDRADHPVVAWIESDGTARNVRVARHDGSAWDLSYGVLSAIDGANTDGAAPQILLDSSDTPIVAWQETDGTRFSTFVWRSNH